jgi:hypothetical protein
MDKRSVNEKVEDFRVNPFMHDMNISPWRLKPPW